MPCASDLSCIESSHSRNKTANSDGGRAVLHGTRLGPIATLEIMKNKAGWLISLTGLRKSISEAHFRVCLWGNFWTMLTEVGTPILNIVSAMPCTGRGFRLIWKEKVSWAAAPIPSWLWLWWDRLPRPCRVTSLQGWTVPTQTTSPDKPSRLKGLLLGVLSHP